MQLSTSEYMVKDVVTRISKSANTVIPFAKDVRNFEHETSNNVKTPFPPDFESQMNYVWISECLNGEAIVTLKKVGEQ